jgi:hypothetical protein
MTHRTAHVAPSAGAQPVRRLGGGLVITGAPCWSAFVAEVIADLEDQALAHLLSGHFPANGARTVLAALAAHLLRWTQLLGLPNTTVRTPRPPAA